MRPLKLVLGALEAAWGSWLSRLRVHEQCDWLMATDSGELYRIVLYCCLIWPRTWTMCQRTPLDKHDYWSYWLLGRRFQPPANHIQDGMHNAQALKALSPWPWYNQLWLWPSSLLCSRPWWIEEAIVYLDYCCGCSLRNLKKQYHTLVIAVIVVTHLSKHTQSRSIFLGEIHPNWCDVHFKARAEIFYGLS